MIRKNRSWRIEKQIGKNNISRDASNIYILCKSNIDAEKRYARARASLHIRALKRIDKLVLNIFLMKFLFREYRCNL